MPKVLAMVLAGGRVDELGVLTHLRPKSTVPFGGLYRFIDFTLSNLMHAGIERVGILSQYRSSSLVEHIGTGAAWDMIGRNRGITLLPPFQGMHDSDWYKGTADAVYQNLDFISAHKPDFVLVVSGDHVHNMNYSNLIEYHLDSGADVTAAFVEVPLSGSSRFGLGKIEDTGSAGGRLLEYVEKPEKPISNWASMTTYLFRTDILQEVLEQNAMQESHEFGRDILPYVMESYNVHGFKFFGYWAYSRTLEEYWQANMDIMGERPRIRLAAWGLRTNLDHEAIRDRGPALISTVSGGSLNNVRLYNGVRVEGRVENSILFPGVHIGAGATVRDSILFFDTQVGPGALLDRTISDIGVSIGRGCRVGEPGGRLAVIGTRTQIPRELVLKQGCSVYPEMGADDFILKEYAADSEITPRHYDKMNTAGA